MKDAIKHEGGKKKLTEKSINVLIRRSNPEDVGL